MHIGRNLTVVHIARSLNIVDSSIFEFFPVFLNFDAVSSFCPNISRSVDEKLEIFR